MSRGVIENAKGILHVDRRIAISFQRSELLPNGAIARTPPSSLGLLPLHRVADFDTIKAIEYKILSEFFAAKVPGESWWIGLTPLASPVAVRLKIGDRDGISGNCWSWSLSQTRQNYIVCPPQFAIFGTLEGSHLYQFPPTIRAFELVIIPKSADPSEAEELPPAGGHPSYRAYGAPGRSNGYQPLIFPDPFGGGHSIWETESYTLIPVTFVSLREYQLITGQALPPAPAPEERYRPYLLP